MKPITSDRASWFQCFRQYWHFSFITTSKYFAMPGWELLIRTPLAAIQVSKKGFDMIRDALFSGVVISLFPASWTLRPEEGASLYRHTFKWGSRYTIEHLLVLNGKVAKQ